MNNYFKKKSSCAYECALSSESTVETFNSRVSYCFPLRNEEHKTVFVVELTTNGTFKSNEMFFSDYLKRFFHRTHRIYQQSQPDRLGRLGFYNRSL